MSLSKQDSSENIGKTGFIGPSCQFAMLQFLNSAKRESLDFRPALSRRPFECHYGYRKMASTVFRFKA